MPLPRRQPGRRRPKVCRLSENGINDRGKMVPQNRLLEQAQDKELVLVDGIKVLHADGWALVLPDPEEPVTHVWAEGPSDTEARGLAPTVAWPVVVNAYISEAQRLVASQSAVT